MHCLQVDLHYNGFCNSVLWQLFHYVPLNMDSKLSETRTLQFQWAAHQEANPRFAQVGAVPERDGGWEPREGGALPQLVVAPSAFSRPP